MAIKLVPAPEFGFDLENLNGLQLDAELETAVIISLFTDARATDDELRIAGLTQESNRGWWGDTYPDVEGFALGSKLWLLTRAKKTPETLAKGRDYALDALQWLIDDGAAKTIDAASEWYRNTGILALSIDIRKPDGSRYHRIWDAIAGTLIDPLAPLSFPMPPSGPVVGVGDGALWFDSTDNSSHLPGW